MATVTRALFEWGLKTTRKKLERRNRMTNLEFYKDELKECIKNSSKELGMVNMNVGYGFSDFSKRYVKHYPHDSVAFVDWLLEEHKEKIKLTEFEHNVLKAFTKHPNYDEDDRIDDYSILQEAQSNGCFKGVDENLSIKDILDNCEIDDENKVKKT